MFPRGWMTCLAVVASGGLGMALLFAQQSQQTPSTPTTGSTTTPSPSTPGASPGRTTTPSTTTTTTPSTTTQQQPSVFQEMPRPVYLSGRVMVDDGTPPPDIAIIERVCNGVARPETYTDSKGYFSFQLGQGHMVMQDASVGAGWDGMGTRGMGLGSSSMPGMMRDGFTERQLQNCEIRAALPGYRSDSISLAQRRAFDEPELGVIVLHRMGKVDGRLISATNLAAPKDARKALEKAQDAIKRKKTDEAEKQLQKAVGIYPKYATAWFELGRIQEGRNQVEAARVSYRRALDADSKFITPYLHLALLAVREQKWQEVVETTDQAVKLDPFSYAQAYFFNSLANFNLRNLGAAEKSAREAQKLDGQHSIPKINHLLGVILAQRQDYSGAAEEMKKYLKFAPRAQDADAVRKQLAEVERLLAAGNAQP